MLLVLLMSVGSQIPVKEAKHTHTSHHAAEQRGPRLQQTARPVSARSVTALYVSAQSFYCDVDCSIAPPYHAV